MDDIGHNRLAAPEMSTQLVRYAAARLALAEARAVDEVKGILDMSVALRAYAQQAKDRGLEVDAVEIRDRAERRLGELLLAQKATVGFNTGQRGQLAGRDASGGAVREPPENVLSTLAEAGIDKKLSSRAQQLGSMPEVDYEARVASWRDAALSSDGHGTGLAVHMLKGLTANPEWYTPGLYIEAARKVLGEIDLDPASSDIAQHIVQAAKYFTKEDDGLAQEWYGRVWLNPPYNTGLIRQFAAKLVREYQAGNVSSAIVLTHASPDTGWFGMLYEHCTRVCFTQGRIQFVADSSPVHGSAFYYFGPHPARFEAVFTKHGPCGQVTALYEPGAAA